MIKKIWEFIKNLFKVIDKNIEEPIEQDDPIEEIVDEIVIEEPKEEIIEESEMEEEPKIEPIEEEKVEEPIIEQVEPKQPENNLETTQKEVYVMLTNKERQTYLNKLGLYTIKIDNIRGAKQKNAEKIFNTIFLNKKNDTYTEETDKLLRIIYKSYCDSPYMVDSDWQYFKNFKKSEYKCKCGGKYCNGYPSGIAMKLVMMDQYVRNYFGVAVTLTSGVRCSTHNKNVGGVSDSRHKKGLASDKIVSGKSASEVSKVIKALPINHYCYDITKSAVHGDTNL
jgi:hypothetical protein